MNEEQEEWDRAGCLLALWASWLVVGFAIFAVVRAVNG